MGGVRCDNNNISTSKELYNKEDKLTYKDTRKMKIWREYFVIKQGKPEETN